MILDLSKPARLSVHSALKAVTTFHLDQRQADGARRQQSCDGDATAIRSTMMGYEVVSRQRPNDIPNLPSHIPDIEVWMAPALGCIRLEERWNRDGRLTMIRQAENIRLGDPDPSLFEVPADYTELSPMQVDARFKEWFPDLHRTEPSCEGRAGCQENALRENLRGSREMQLQMENNYWAAQANKQIPTAIDP
jgi:hypothetical protein